MLLELEEANEDVSNEIDAAKDNCTDDENEKEGSVNHEHGEHEEDIIIEL